MPKPYEIYRPGFVVLEGIDGSGKGTQAEILKSSVEENYSNIRVKLTFEPTNTNLGNLIRAEMKNKLAKDMRRLALLFAADRLYHVEKVINPSLKRGDFLICDRYVYSSLAYQGQNEFVDFKWICNLNYFVTPPDIVFILDIPVREAMTRIKNRGKEFSEQFEKRYFFLEKASDFFRCLCSESRLNAYLKYKGLKVKPEFLKTRFIKIDSTKPKEEIQQEIRFHVDRLFSGEYTRKSLSFLKKTVTNRTQTKVWDFIDK